MRKDGTENPASWEAIYQAGDAGWDIGKPAPPFVKLWSGKPSWLTPGKLICFGAGAGHDAQFFAENGFQVTAVDFAPTAISSIKKYSEKTPNLFPLQEDILSLPTSLNSSFDYVLEHTCFCALPRMNLTKYVEAAHKVLKAEGILFGLFYRFDPQDENGPPFSTNEKEVRELFEEFFEIFLWETPKNSHGKRQNRERLVAMRKKI